MLLRFFPEGWAFGELFSSVEDLYRQFFFNMCLDKRSLSVQGLYKLLFWFVFGYYFPLSRGFVKVFVLISCFQIRSLFSWGSIQTGSFDIGWIMLSGGYMSLYNCKHHKRLLFYRSLLFAVLYFIKLRVHTESAFFSYLGAGPRSKPYVCAYENKWYVFYEFHSWAILHIQKTSVVIHKQLE